MTADVAHNITHMLDAGARRAVEAIVECAIRHGGEVTWPATDVDPAGGALVRAADPSRYSGDAGIAFTLRRLGDRWADERLLQLAPPSRSSGSGPFDTETDPSFSDLTSGIAGTLLTAVRRAAPADDVLTLVATLRRRAVRAELGVYWVDDARGLCGLAHGASGIALALVEAAAAYPAVTGDALALAADALAWESSWSDPMLGGWPDLRGHSESWPALWCHGAAGAGLVRLRLLELAERARLPWALDSTRAEAEVAIQQCGRAVTTPSHAGLTWCHGLGGPLLLLAAASRAFGVEDHLQHARRHAAAALALLPEDPTEWPSGIQGADGDLGLLTGLAGTAVVLDALANPDDGILDLALLDLT